MQIINHANEIEIRDTLGSLRVVTSLRMEVSVAQEFCGTRSRSLIQGLIKSVLCISFSIYYGFDNIYGFKNFIGCGVHFNQTITRIMKQWLCFVSYTKVLGFCSTIYPGPQKLHLLFNHPFAFPWY